jgi:glyoxylase-like metal-dependent hydrolase (beta-lactamase superfamily II)
LIWCRQSRAAAVVDPGGDLDRVLAAAGRQGLSIGTILLTHGHLDHAGAAAELASLTGATIRGPHIADRFLLEELDAGDRSWLEDIDWLEDGDQVSLGDVVLDVRHCPGHTPGHLAFVDRASRLAWVGDVLFAGSIGTTVMEYADMRQLIRSIVERLWPFGDDIRFLPGHGRTSTFGAERQLNPFVSDLVVEFLGLDPGG